jgi:LysW-gamma-L-lysine carboxypeptidase
MLSLKLNRYLSKDQNNMDDIALLEGLLEQYSPSGEEAGAVGYLVEQMQILGYTAAIDGAGNAVGRRGNGSREILLLGHIDTVPGYIDVKRDGDILHGRGAVDAKGPLACFTAAAARIDPPPGWKVTVIGAVGEESTSTGARYLLEHHDPPAMVVIGEPSGWDHVTLGYKGSAWFTYTLSESMTHTAARTISSCEAAVLFWHNLLQIATDYNAPYNRVFDQFSPTLREMGSSNDGFYQTAQLKIGVRIPVGFDASRLLNLISDVASHAEIHIDDFTPAYKAEKNTPVVRAILAGVRSQNGHPGFTLKTGTADMNIVGPRWNCPIAAYGPGDSNLDHTPGEYILIHEYQTSINVLVVALEQIMKNTPELQGY